MCNYIINLSCMEGERVMDRRPTVLLADDSETFVMYLSVLLQRLGLDIIAVSDGEEALRLVPIVQPDMVMLDVHMPGVDGIDVLRQIRASSDMPELPVVMVTSDTREETYMECLRLKCSGYLTKPVRLRHLHEVVEDAMLFGEDRKRRFPRAHICKKVRLSHGGRAQECYAVSLSEGGMYLRKREPLPVGSNVEIELPLHNGGTLNLRGTVIYQKGLYGDMLKIAPGMGIEFNGMGEEDSSLLRSYIMDSLAGDILNEQEGRFITP